MSNLIYALFIAVAIYVMGGRIYQAERVTIDVIRGGICIYLLIGSLWFLFYSSIELLDQSAFSHLTQRHGIYPMMYFSFTTLTTLGYGDILPTQGLAMFLANVESVLGQLFPAIFIARLVSLYIVHDRQD
ncbi:potassium channel family protein [Neosynechococcus sphagnicola]|uniref:potassium channel family protein n=1 Tax=Neosynechococcus sphagnicola TaxID=1501145 RepID=UPI00138E3924|nr:potassium channel family protein [Neosynechococcus sphagnicola]